MNGFDILVGIPLLYAAYQGFRDGIVVQLSGMIGLFIGVYFAFRYSVRTGTWLHIDPPIAAVVGFIAILLLILLLIALLGHLIKKIFKLAGLGPLDAIGGILLSVLKMGLIISLLLIAFETANQTTHWVENDKYQKSVLYKPIRESGHLLFPYLNLMKHKLDSNSESL